MHSGKMNLQKTHAGKNQPDYSISRRLFSTNTPHPVFEKKHLQEPFFFRSSSEYAISPEGKLVKLFYCREPEKHGLMKFEPPAQRKLTSFEKRQIRDVFVHSFEEPVWTQERGYVKKRVRLNTAVFEYQRAFDRLLTGEYGGAEKWEAIGKLDRVQFCFGACVRGLARELEGIAASHFGKSGFSYKDTNTSLSIAAPGYEAYMFIRLDTIGGKYGFYVHTSIKNGHDRELKPLLLNEENMRHVSEMLGNSMLCHLQHGH
ncbi:MAG: hypothetical protein WC506_01375 [Candidatus Micrarchaeia archaeon]